MDDMDASVVLRLMQQHPLMRECLAECIGTWLMLFLGLATGAASVATGLQSGFWQVAVVWGFAIALATFLTAHISGAHLNPAVTISLAYSRVKFPKRKVLPYITAQMVGAIAAGASVLAVYGSAIARYESRNRITRGEANSTLSAMLFGEYFPNPQLVQSGMLAPDDVTTTGALLIEALGTMVLIVLIRALTDDANHARPTKQQVPFFVGFLVACLASFIAPLSQAGFNPARDFGPRLVAAMAGWGAVALPGPGSCFWVYIVGPIAGGLLGGALYDTVVHPAYVAKNEAGSGEYVRLLGDDELTKSLNNNGRAINASANAFEGSTRVAAFGVQGDDGRRYHASSNGERL